MKKENEIPNVANLITFDTLKDEEKDAAKQVGITLYSFQEVIEAGK